MQEELLQFKLQKVWTLVDLPNGKRAIGTKWVFRNKKDKRGIVVRNKARLMDVKSALLYGTIEEEVYMYQPPGFEDPQFPDKVYKVEKALYGLHQAPKAWYETLSTYLIENGFRRGTIDKTLFIKKDKGDILLVQVQDKYVAEILKKFDFATVKTTSTLIETNKALVKDEEAEAVDVHLYRSMIGSLMYLTASRPDIMFAVCAYAKDSPFDLEAFSDSDYARASLDRKSTIGDCQFLGKRVKQWILHNTNGAFIINVNLGVHELIIHIEALFEGRLYGTMCISTADYTSWMLRIECKSCQVMKIGLELKDKKELAIPGQTATGKEFSNPLMAGSLPKTISAKVSTASTNLVLLA
ncbi:putative ribonuclease H-like domain-containing protein [Tanacetum coccineum]